MKLDLWKHLQATFKRNLEPQAYFEKFDRPIQQVEALGRTLLLNLGVRMYMSTSENRVSSDAQNQIGNN